MELNSSENPAEPLELPSPSDTQLWLEYERFSSSLLAHMQNMSTDIPRKLMYSLFWFVTRRLLEMSSGLVKNFIESATKFFRDDKELYLNLSRKLRHLNEDEITNYCWQLPPIYVTQEEHTAVISAIKYSKAVQMAMMLRDGVCLRIRSSHSPEGPPDLGDPIKSGPSNASTMSSDQDPFQLNGTLSAPNSVQMKVFDLMLKKHATATKGQDTVRSVICVHLTPGNTGTPVSEPTCATLSQHYSHALYHSHDALFHQATGPLRLSDSSDSPVSSSPWLHCPSEQLLVVGHNDGHLSLFQVMHLNEPQTSTADTSCTSQHSGTSDGAPSPTLSSTDAYPGGQHPLTLPNVALQLCGRLPQWHSRPHRPATAVKFMQDPRYFLATNADGVIRLWDVNAKQVLLQYTNDDSLPVWAVATCAMYPSLFATASQNTLASLWCTDRPQPLRSYIGAIGGVRSVSFHSNGRYLATGDNLGHVRLYDTRSADCMYVWDPRYSAVLENGTFPAQSLGSVTALSFGPCGHLLASGCEFGHLCVMDLRMCGHSMLLQRGLDTTSNFTNGGQDFNFTANGNATTTSVVDDTLGAPVSIFNSRNGPLADSVELQAVNDILWSPHDSFFPSVSSSSGSRDVCGHSHRFISTTVSGVMNSWSLQCSTPVASTPILPTNTDNLSPGPQSSTPISNSTSTSVLNSSLLAVSHLRQRLVHLHMGEEKEAPLVAVLWGDNPNSNT